MTAFRGFLFLVAVLVVMCCISPAKADGTIADSDSFLAGLFEQLDAEWPDNRTITIVCHGHSVPAGYFKTPFVDTFNAYPHLLHRALKERFPHAVINVIVTAIGGESSDSGAERFERDVLTLRPDLIFIDYALNDRGIGLEKAKVAWTKMIKMAQEQNIPLILLTPTADIRSDLLNPDDPLSLHAQQIRDLATEFSTGLADSYAAFQSHVREGKDLEILLSQINHPNRQGHELVLAEILKWFPNVEHIRKNPMHIYYPQLHTGNRDIDKAFRIALGDLFSNIQEYESGLLAEPAPVILAGLDYNRPWTRDASINSWNAGSLIVPDVAKNTLLSVLQNENGVVRIGGQYWDAVVWITGAWHHYLFTEDVDFLRLAFKVASNSLAYSEAREFDAEFNLFRGLGWSDGVAAYEGKYAHTNGASAAWAWPQENPDKAINVGYGIPMMAISTNCLYYNAYKTVELMARELGESQADELGVDAESLKRAINQFLWNEKTGVYNFYIDHDSVSELQETLGNAYAILFGVADAKQRENIFKNQYVAPAGVPCGWPPLPRYQGLADNSFARHNGTVWPQIQGFWAEAAARFEKVDLFSHELFNLARHAVRDQQFVEIYHPITGEPYGGWQERGESGIGLWSATNRQTWAATAYLRMILNGLAGMRVDKSGVRFEPCVPLELEDVKLQGLYFRDMIIDLDIRGTGTTIGSVHINGEKLDGAFLSNIESGRKTVEIVMKKL